MLIYIATYPRAGNSWLRSIVQMNWRYLVSNGYPGAELEIPDKWRVVAYDDHTLTYQTQHGPDRRTVLAPGCLDWLTEDKRRELAARDERIFVKTHERPYARFFPGEMAVQMIRHPVDTLASWLKLDADFGKDEPTELERLLKGQGFGSWSEHLLLWERSGIPLWRQRFEDARADEEAVIRSMGMFLGLPVVDLKTDFLATNKARNPKRYSGGYAGRWRKVFTEEQARDVWERFASTAVLHGYQPPMEGS